MPTLDKYDPKPSLPLSEEAWRDIEDTLGLDEPDVGLRCRIARYVDIFFLGLTANLPRVRVGLLRKRLKLIQKNAARLLSDFEISSEDRDEEWALFCALELIQDRAQHKALRLSLSELIAKADEELHLLPQGGRPPDERYPNLILALAAVYRIARNKEPTISFYDDDDDPDLLRYRSKFCDFVVSVLDAIGDEMAKPQNNQALGQRINRALRVGRETRGA